MIPVFVVGQKFLFLFRCTQTMPHNRAVYTRENKPRLILDANTPYIWYKIYVHGFLKPRLILGGEFILVYKIVPFAYYVRCGQSKPRLIFSRINGPNIYRREANVRIRKKRESDSQSNIPSQ